MCHASSGLADVWTSLPLLPLDLYTTYSATVFEQIRYSTDPRKVRLDEFPDEQVNGPKSICRGRFKAGDTVSFCVTRERGSSMVHDSRSCEFGVSDRSGSLPLPESWKIGFLVLPQFSRPPSERRSAHHLKSTDYVAAWSPIPYE